MIDGSGGRWQMLGNTWKLREASKSDKNRLCCIKDSFRWHSRSPLIKGHCLNSRGIVLFQMILEACFFLKKNGDFIAPSSLSLKGPLMCGVVIWLFFFNRFMINDTSTKLLAVLSSSSSSHPIYFILRQICFNALSGSCSSLPQALNWRVVADQFTTKSRIVTEGGAGWYFS